MNFKITSFIFFVLFSQSICAQLNSYSPPLTKEAQELKLRREMTALAFATHLSVTSILEYVAGKRGMTSPIARDEKKPDQWVLIDSEGIRWTSETDGGVVELRNERGDNPFVFETKTNWFKAHEVSRMLLSLESLLALGATPDYRFGGGHIKIRLKPYFENHPLAFASLINLFLTYEPILVHLMAHKRRVENAKSMMSERMTPAQLAIAGLRRDDRTTLAQYLGHGLNAILKDEMNCQMPLVLKQHFDREAKAELSSKENCILAWLAHFATEVVGAREFGINLHAWRGAHNPMRLKDALELRFFNAPNTLMEAEMEEALVRAMADQAIRAANNPIHYQENFQAYYDLESFFWSYFPERRQGDFRELLQSSGFPDETIKLYIDQYLDESKWLKRRLN